MIEEADTDGDGEVGQDEFIRVLKKTQFFWIKYQTIYDIKQNLCTFEIFFILVNSIF